MGTLNSVNVLTACPSCTLKTIKMVNITCRVFFRKMAGQQDVRTWTPHSIVMLLHRPCSCLAWSPETRTSCSSASVIQFLLL